MRLVACRECHTQYDASQVAEERIRCHCGASIENRAPEAVDVPVQRCSACGAALAPDSEHCGYCDSAIEREPGKLSLICPECFARNRESSRFCGGCGVAFRPQPLLVPGEKLRCPACEREMQPRAINGIGVSECLVCHGLWVPGESFDALLEQAIAGWRAQAAPARPLAGRLRRRAALPDKLVYRRCPRCASPMTRKNFGRASGVIVDWCGEHGTWLDADELEAIADFILSGRGAAAAGGAAAVSTLRFPSAETVRARTEAERLQADEKAKSRERLERIFGRHAESEFSFTVGDLFEAIFKIGGFPR